MLFQQSKETALCIASSWIVLLCCLVLTHSTPLWVDLHQIQMYKTNVPGPSTVIQITGDINVPKVGMHGSFKHTIHQCGGIELQPHH
jgi:hypothetical protein